MGLQNNPIIVPGLISCFALIIVVFGNISLTGAATFFTSNYLSSNNNLRFLGIADGKSYFYQTFPHRTWEEAKDYCNTYDLELATVESINQVELLNTTLSTLTTGYVYWTSARESESRRPLNITWGRTQEQLDPSLLSSWYWGVREFQYCGTVKIITLSVSGSYKRFEMDMVGCDSKAFTLCQCQSPTVK